MSDNIRTSETHGEEFYSEIGRKGGTITDSTVKPKAPEPKKEKPWFVRVLAENQIGDPAKDVIVIEVNREQEPKVIRIYHDHMEADVREPEYVFARDNVVKTKRLFWEDWLWVHKALRYIKRVFVNEKGELKE